ncbi:MAG: metallophosphoesterase [Bacteroidales bacterium]
MFDIIGDVHGNADALKTLLLKMGYRKNSGHYSHPERKAVFTGDFVNRGKKVRQTLNLVRRMVENHSAYAVMGNHEYNLICYHTKSLGRGFLRKHNSANRNLFYYTSKAFRDHPDEWRVNMEWIKQLPLFFEFEHFRVVHACWNKRIVKFVKRNLPGNRMTEAFLHNSARAGTIEREVVDVLLSGVEIPVDRLTTVINLNGKPVDRLRIKWWMQPGNQRLGTVALGDYRVHPNRLITKREKSMFLPYSEKKRPLFIGHYCLKEEAGLQAPNICCVDYCYYRKGRLAAYRMGGETKLKAENLILV